ncbi:hypothetical protein GCM10017673_14520 [Streptosporangium violaceochromogenes]|nr:hypothetical protein GCM10017673_14520 [Streptosporangium violaceochromogenes]
MPEQYKKGERLRVAVEGVVAPTPQGEDPTPGELTITVDTPDGPYDVTVPLGCVTVERLIPADGEPRPTEVWRDCSGTDRWAYLDPRSGEMCLIGPDGIRNQWSHFNIVYGPLTRVHPPVSAALAAPAEQAETAPEEPTLVLGDHYRDSDGGIWQVVAGAVNGELRLTLDDDDDLMTWAEVNRGYGPLVRVETPDALRLVLGDRWEDRDGDEWQVIEEGGQLRLMLDDDDGLSTWAEVNRSYGPLALVQRAGYRPTTDTVPGERLTIGMVVSCPKWAGGAPVRLTAPEDIVSGEMKRGWELLGDGEAGADAVLPHTSFTVWEPVGGAR